LLRFANIALVLALLGGAAAAFAVAERVKLERSPVTAPRFDPPHRRFSPVCRCRTDSAAVSLRLRRTDTVEALVVDAAGTVVRTLFSGRKARRGSRVVLSWDGRDAAGDVVPDGRYRLGVHLEGERRTIVVPIPVWVDTRPPKVKLVSATPAVISPDGDGRSDRLRVVYAASEKAVAELAVDGVVVLSSKARAPGRAALNWHGTLPGETPGERVPVRAGAHELVLSVRDLAGNVRTLPVELRVRYIELAGVPAVVPAGGTLTFSVSTDATFFRWYLFRPHEGRLGRPVLYDESATGAAVSATLPTDLAPGAYLLRVGANGHRDKATVTVGEPAP